jgi:hypothetical protein
VQRDTPLLPGHTINGSVINLADSYLDLRGIMRRNQSQIRLIVENSMPVSQLTDTSGSPSESYDWEHMAVVRQEWQNEFWQPSVNSFEPTLTEITSIETQVRKELYP